MLRLTHMGVIITAFVGACVQHVLPQNVLFTENSMLWFKGQKESITVFRAVINIGRYNSHHDHLFKVERSACH